MRRDVGVAYPDEGRRQPNPPLPCYPLPWRPASVLRSRATLRPHLGGHYLFPMLGSLLA